MTNRAQLYQMTRFRHLIFGAAVGLLPVASAAAELQDPAQIRRAIEALVQAQTHELPGRVELARAEVDSHLRLARCP